MRFFARVHAQRFELFCARIPSGRVSEFTADNDINNGE